MISKNRIRYIQSLHKKKTREQQRQFIAEGEKIVADLLKSDFDLMELYATKEWIANTSENILSRFDVVEISEKELEQISTLQTPNNVLAVVNFKDSHPDWNTLGNGYSLLLDSIRDPGNLGTIIRIADWFGIKNIICSESTVEMYNPKVIQSAMGSAFRVCVYYENLIDILNKNKSEYNLPVYGTLLEGESIYRTNFKNNGIVLIGNESRGLSRELVSAIDWPVTIPLYNETSRIDSLNAAVATGIICSEVKRQMTFK